MWSRITLSLSAFLTLGIASCPRQVPAPPRLVWGQCALNWPKGGQPALYCVDPETGKCRLNTNGGCLVVPINSPYAKGAQVLFPQDYIAMSEWLDKVLEIAQRRCQ